MLLSIGCISRSSACGPSPSSQERLKNDAPYLRPLVSQATPYFGFSHHVPPPPQCHGIGLDSIPTATLTHALFHRTVDMTFRSSSRACTANRLTRMLPLSRKRFWPPYLSRLSCETGRQNDPRCWAEYYGHQTDRRQRTTNDDDDISFDSDSSYSDSDIDSSDGDTNAHSDSDTDGHFEHTSTPAPAGASNDDDSSSDEDKSDHEEED
ncbi:hypothetical protein V8E53_006751 [Lactarius tabidus]